MSLPYDATVKHLLRYAADWLRQLGVEPGGPVAPIDADLSTVTAAADRAFRVDAAEPWLLHLEIQAGRDPTLPGRLLNYNGLLYDPYSFPVRSVVVLLRREAMEPGLTGVLEFPPHPVLGGLRLEYRVARVWEWSSEALLQGGLGTLPLAPLAAGVTADSLPELVRRMDERLGAAEPAEADRLWTAAFVLLGLRFPAGLVEQLLQGVRTMKESSTYQWIVEQGAAKGREEGRLEMLRSMLLDLGRARWGAPGAASASTLQGIADVERLRRMTRRLLEVGSWDELLATA